MKIMNIGILAHVDAGKTTLTESILYASGTITESGRVDRGSTITDSMALEKQRGITIQASIASYQWGHVKVNLIDTPGHIDFYSEVERSLNVLDGAILLISAKDGIQAQTRILFDAIRKRKLPALIFITNTTTMARIPSPATGPGAAAVGAEVASVIMKSPPPRFRSNGRQRALPIRRR